jgi:hypothetical protein
VRDIEETDGRPTVRSNIIVERPFVVTVVFRLFAVWLVSIILGERVVITATRFENNS